MIFLFDELVDILLTDEFYFRTLELQSWLKDFNRVTIKPIFS